jgi:GTP cyclohydrolase I
LEVSKSGLNAVVVNDAAFAHVIVDDLIDSGATLRAYTKKYPDKPFHALFDKREGSQTCVAPWYVFPWERTEANSDESFSDNVTRLLQYVGEKPARGGLLETPARVAKAWKFWCSGYDKDPAQILKVFEDGAEKHNQMVTVKDIPIYSHCEHHLAAIFGTATISYIPNGKIVGLSKLNRLADMFARRLQVQERLTDQIADALHEHLNPLGVGVVIRARHMCMESRGVCQQGHQTITTALRGVILEQPAARAEFMRFV